MILVYGRENGGQLFELTTTSAAKQLLEYWGTEDIDVGECYRMYLDFLQIVAPSQYLETIEIFEGKSDDVLIDFIGGMICDGCMNLDIEPMSEMMDIDKVAQIYKKFPWMRQKHIIVPLVSSTGKIQYIESHRPVVAGYVYYYRLKQHAKEKFSVTSLSATNIRNENSRNKASKMYKALYSRTPIRFGDMEIGDLGHLSSDIIVQMLMLYATSPLARQLYDQLMTGDPFNIDIRLDDTSTNRNAEIVETCLKTIGKRIIFRKVKKELARPIQYSPMLYYMNDPKDWDPIICFGEGNAPYPALEEMRQHPNWWPITFNPIQWYLPPEDAKRKIAEDAEKLKKMMEEWKAKHP